jgi:hypothetical protein
MLTSPTWQMLRSESAHAIRGTGQTLQWLATDTANGAGAWFVERRPDGATWRPPTRQADVTVTGPAGSLLLTLTRRLPLTDRETTNISVAGDADLAQPWLDNTAHVSDGPASLRRRRPSSRPLSWSAPKVTSNRAFTAERTALTAAWIVPPVSIPART